ncbi:phosphoglucosamine mutase [Fannyhessea vaginae]|jgi:phosphoglucosamine mutase|uniref:Phosphoglucosamine mutase n=1 Tax=Fannyhessea vaginae DSM 15829 TaxID=525256 RepID=F1T580_9ACTN|nr:phosphoglucosamine mutase [Fannyhessea vaginae]CRH61576.1 phosphoglucosamine mutase [Chlamydia trachomatis]EGF23101.1 phosphoglucosamine mutase [Fannyhessea vaginae DSM 15829]KXG89365.1 phosphoglucosamine mutase [Fannyhessea vaginae]QPR41345.1 phosphoglucosamine mutase [Fannyhessea vaginae]SSZ03121.1 Phosphoglucosamine mutase [Fannyhessea vaginae]
MKYFGTDGFRGKANEGLRVDHAFKIGRFIGWYYGLREGKKARILLGKDTRRSSYMFESALVSGLVASGADTYILHVIPTPGLSYEVLDGGFDCGIMITASHNPFDDNGIKLVNSEGYKMDEDVLLQVEAYIDGASDVPLATGDKIGCTVDYMQGRNRYIAHLIASCGFSMQGWRVGLDCANGAASSVARPVFDAMGAETHVINNAPSGFNINVDCGSTHIERLQDLVLRNHLDVGFAYDGDADRCLAVDERGHVIDGDLILYICGTYLAKHGRLAKNTIVPTVMSNFGLFKAFDDAGISYVKTDVGDKNVWAAMMKGGFSLGGEQSGHVIFSDLEKTGDGIMTSLRVMEVLNAEREKLSELARPVVRYPQQLINVHVADKKAVMEAKDVTAAIHKAQEFLEGNGRVLVRASGTEPLIRVLAEAPTDELCEKANAFVLQALEPYKA